MEPGRGSEPTSETKPLSDACEETARGSEALQPEAEPPSESPDASPPEPQPPGKLRKTAFKLFGGRKSICALPSFFGGRNKTQGKGSSKKGISKSKTHDCISKVSWEEGRGAGCVPSGDFEYHCQKGSAGRTLTNSVSAHTVNDPGKRTEFPKGESCHLLTSEAGDHKLGVEKSLSFPRPMKGLRGLFSSIRRHKKNKNVESEKSEVFELSVDIPKDLVPVSESGVSHHLGSLAEPNVPTGVNVKERFIITNECIANETLPENETAQIKLDSQSLKESQSLKDTCNDVGERTGALNANGETLCSNSEFTYIPNVSTHSAENDQPSVHSSDQISLIFGDVASLKSFDSLTGCGDIIADQDDDSVAESTVSGERSRNAGKRSSCYVTYQGGGEEMATPDEVDEDYLQGLWENEAAADVCYTSSQQPDFMEHDEVLQPALPSPEMEATCNHTIPHAVVDVSLTPGDVLTPQSDQQESVPNSDEGYYDSTTPGPDDDVDRGVGRLGKERLPRDSYSGDALYELFEPDESLMSPPLQDETFETQPPTPDPLEFLGVKLQSNDSKLYPGLSHKTGLMETEEARLAKIQQELLCCELQGIQKASKELAVLAKGRYFQEKSISDCIPKLNKPHQSGLKEEQAILQVTSQKGKSVQQGSLNLKDSKSEILSCNGGSSQKTHDQPYIKATEAVCCTHVTKMPHPLQELSSYTEQSNQMAALTENRGKTHCSNKTEAETEYDQTVCFSQALVDFTKHSKLFNSLSDGLESSDSSSSFAQNMQALPAMVTFDVVDMENEGECDRQIEMVTDEDIVSPHEAYDESYLQKDAFAECDDRMFNFYDQSLFLRNSWGVASLPRHLSLTRVNQPMPAPLSLNRRSRSLDTDSLEFEVSDMYLAQPRVGPSLNHVTRTERDSKRVSSLHRKRTGDSTSSEPRDSTDLMVVTQQQESAGSFMRPSTDGKRVCQVQGLAPAQKDRAKPPCGPMRRPEAQPVGRPPNWKTRPQISKRAVEDRVACNTMPQSPGHLTRPSHLPLQSGDCISHQPQRTFTGTSRESLCDRTDCTSDDRSEAYFLKNYALTQYSDSSHQHTKVKPIGVTQGVPHFHSDISNASKPAIFQEHREFISKGRKAVDAALPVECNKRTT
ncbi:APC membrane recruitment protein 1 [Megalops cyprinoides]|uniref:APC membrane recruitment protein 1 n=1 Tax=Megalops cyprinoides TaxID=118141 RepID=UPI00186546DE|nr:APC membrane recruitment protein 1 [Megalops cyprinoides]